MILFKVSPSDIVEPKQLPGLNGTHLEMADCRLETAGAIECRAVLDFKDCRPGLPMLVRPDFREEPKLSRVLPGSGPSVVRRAAIVDTRRKFKSRLARPNGKT